MSIDFTDKVAIVTGAGGGLGRTYALELARRGAKVVVNDLGGARDGTGHSDAALKVVEEIEEAGGTAMSNGGDVSNYEQMEAMVAKAKEEFGGVHILINNAGILRDKSFSKMEPADIDLVVKVHLIGSAYATKAVWETMREQNYGRILMTSSFSGIGGNFGQANYAAAKTGMIGLARTLVLEGAKNGIKVNTIVPTAGTRMTEDILPGQAFDAFAPENVTPAALFLVSEDAPNNVILGAGGGTYHQVFLTINDAHFLSPDNRTPEGVAAAWETLNDRSADWPIKNGMEIAMHEMKIVSENAAKG